MRVQLLSAVGAVAILMVGAVGCSKDDSSSAATTSAATSSAPAATAAPTGVAGSAKITVDGQPKTVDGPVVCATTDGKFSIAIGDVITGVIVGLEQDASKVRGVGLGDVNGVVLSFTDGVPGDTATATKDGIPIPSRALPVARTRPVSRSASRSRLSPPAPDGSLFRSWVAQQRNRFQRSAMWGQAPLWCPTCTTKSARPECNSNG